MVEEQKATDTLETDKVLEADHEGDIFFDSEEYQAEELEVQQVYQSASNVSTKCTCC